METEQPHRSYISTVLSCRCPRCREGMLFKNSVSIRINRNMEMFERCIICGQPTDIEVGFYYGTSYISYLIAVVISIVTFFLWWLIIGFSFTDNRFFYWIGINALLLIAMQPWLMRFSRSLWISWFVRYDPEWKKKQPENYERINRDQMSNW